MSDTNTRLLEAARALHRLEIQIEQHRLDVEELAGQSYEAEKARAELEKMRTELAWQRKYCDLLANAELAEDLSARTGSRVA